MLDFLTSVSSGFASAVVLFGGGELQEDVFQAEADGAQFIQIPAGVDDGARQVGADVAALEALDFESAGGRPWVPSSDHAADAGDLFQALLDFAGVGMSVGGFDFERDGFGAAQPVGEIGDRVDGHQLALVDDDDALAGVLDFGEDVGAEDDGVIAGRGCDAARGSR